LIWVKNFLLV